MLEGVLDSDLKDNKITVIATTVSLDLNEKLFTSRGRHYFKNIYNMPDLNKVTNYITGLDNDCTTQSFCRI